MPINEFEVANRLQRSRA